MKFAEKVKRNLRRRTDARKRIREMNAVPFVKIGNDRPEEIIVSLTSFPKRFPVLSEALKSILWQTLLPDRFILYISADVPQETLPREVTDLKAYGLEIENRIDLKPHTKYFYAMKENPDALLITVDDDLMYPRDMIEKLYATYRKFPDCVIADRAHEMTFDEAGNLLPYRQFRWESGRVDVPSADLLATGCGGVLYPPHIIDPKFLDEDLLRRLAFAADDVYLKMVETVKGTRVTVSNTDVWKNTRIVTHSQKIALRDTNNGQSANDLYLKNCMEYFRLARKDFI